MSNTRWAWKGVRVVFFCVVVTVVVVAAGIAGIAESSLDFPLLFLSSIFSDADNFDKNEGSMAIRNYYLKPAKDDRMY